MEKKQIRLTFYYTDRTAYNIASNKVRSSLVNWANEFFEKYGYELHTYPIPYDKKIYEDNYIIAEKGGKLIRFNAVDEFDIQGNYWDQITDKIKMLSAQKNKDIAKINELILKLQNVEESMRIIQNVLEDDCFILRNTINTKYLDNLKRAYYFGDLSISQSSRLVVIFGLSAKLTAGASGYTQIPTGRRSTWPPFIFINLGGYLNEKIIDQSDRFFTSHRRTLVHEIVHSIGGNHQSIEDSKKEGLNNSIMNITPAAWGIPPSQVIIDPKDLSSLEHAFFVV